MKYKKKNTKKRYIEKKKCSKIYGKKQILYKKNTNIKKRLYRKKFHKRGITQRKNINRKKMWKKRDYS